MITPFDVPVRPKIQSRACFSRRFAKINTMENHEIHNMNIKSVCAVFQVFMQCFYGNCFRIRKRFCGTPLV